ncbi:MAG: hypothetical protein IAE97_10530 [Chthoniobacterales bacterium]|nr:hypothetical protein [Chthoniobacterales bacterium]
MPAIEIPQVNPVKIELPDDPRANPPPDETFTHGTWINRKDGLPYVLAVHEPDGYFRTHSAKNSAYFWQGSEDEFHAQFIKQ